MSMLDLRMKLESLEAERTASFEKVEKNLIINAELARKETINEFKNFFNAKMFNVECVMNGANSICTAKYHSLQFKLISEEVLEFYPYTSSGRITLSSHQSEMLINTIDVGIVLLKSFRDSHPSRLPTKTEEELRIAIEHQINENEKEEQWYSDLDNFKFGYRSHIFNEEQKVFEDFKEIIDLFTSK